MEATEELDTTSAPETETQVQEPAADALPAQDDSPANDTSGGGVDGADASSGIDEELVQLAQRYGFEASSDPKSLIRHLATTFDRELAQQGRQTWQQPANGSGQQQAQQQTQAAPKSAFDLDKLLPPELAAGEYDEALVNYSKQSRAALKAIADHYNSQLSSVKEEVAKDWSQRFETLEQFQMQQEQERVSSQIDGFFTGLGAEWSGEFGNGSVKGMSPHSQHLKARNAVVEEALALQAGYAARGMQSPELGTLLTRALNSLHGHQQATKARQKLVSDAAAKKSAATSGAGGKRSQPLSGRERAEATFREGLRQLGLATE